MILLLIFIILFSWAVLKGIETGSELEKSRAFEREQIEYVIPIKEERRVDEKILSIVDYLREEKEKEEMYNKRVEEFVNTRSSKVS